MNPQGSTVAGVPRGDLPAHQTRAPDNCRQQRVRVTHPARCGITAVLLGLLVTFQVEAWAQDSRCDAVFQRPLPIVRYEQPDDARVDPMVERLAAAARQDARVSVLRHEQGFPAAVALLDTLWRQDSLAAEFALVMMIDGSVAGGQSAAFAEWAYKQRSGRAAPVLSMIAPDPTDVRTIAGLAVVRRLDTDEERAFVARLSCHAAGLLSFAASDSPFGAAIRADRHVLHWIQYSDLVLGLAQDLLPEWRD